MLVACTIGVQVSCYMCIINYCVCVSYHFTVLLYSPVNNGLSGLRLHICILYALLQVLEVRVAQVKKRLSVTYLFEINERTDLCNLLHLLDKGL